MRRSRMGSWDVTRFSFSVDVLSSQALGKATWSYMVKPHGSLVSVSSALLRYTPDLSTT